MTLGVRKVKLLGVAAVALLAMSASGCSSLPSAPDWVDPTTWFGDDAPNAQADNGQAPDLASLPDKPNAAGPDDKQQVADSLATDRANAKYSAEALRAGSEPAAAPPPDAPVAPKVVAEAPKKPVAPVAAPVQQSDPSIARDPAGATAPGTLPATAPGVASLPPPPVQTAALPEAAAPAAAPQAAPQAVPEPPKRARKKVAIAEPVTSETPAPAVEKPVRARPAPVRTAQPQLSAPTPAAISPSDAELGFKPSSAPPLDASVSQFVAAPVIDRYRSTAHTAGLAQPPYPTSPRPYVVTKARPRAARTAMGGPEHMTGAVVANFDALGGSSSAAPAYTPAQATGGAAAVVYFPADSVGLTAEGRALVRAAVEQFRAAGGQGYVRVVGHSSSRTPNMSPEKHLEIIFKKSQARADVVAQALIRAGVPADRVLVEAVGDTQPVYYESMPKGEEGNRRAEIFLQG